ncbi:MAG: Crp/Fnr family transcriptional regulator [Planctomycetota bacterium]|jgi:CRP-like cAMP-binding protein|nr:Crp/Fnr family transcriptional regulator [Planctomycetota bacterium]
MENFFPALATSPLFAGIAAADFAALLACLGASVKTYKKGEIIYFEGDAAAGIGLVVKGRLHLVKGDIRGNNSLVAEVTPPETFAEAVVCGGIGRVPVGVVAREDSGIMFLDYGKIAAGCPSACAFHSRLIRNIIGVLARKNILLLERVEHVAKRTTGEKLLSYLAERAKRTGGGPFEIPFNRQELADYLFVERSALSAEMGRLKSRGIIKYRKNRFELIGEAEP